MGSKITKKHYESLTKNRLQTWIKQVLAIGTHN